MIRKSLAQTLAKSSSHAVVSQLHQRLAQNKTSSFQSPRGSQVSSMKLLSGTTQKRKSHSEKPEKFEPVKRRKRDPLHLPVVVSDNRILQCSKVKPKTLKVYDRSASEFVAWCKLNNKSLGSHLRTDEAMSRYIHELCWEGVSLTEASYAVFGYIMLRSPSSWHMHDREKFPISRQALKGWKARFPGKSRTGVDLVLWDLVALSACEVGNFFTAAAIILQGDTYLRPSELLELTVRHMLKPCRRQKCWGVMVGLSDDGVPAKNGEFDECVFLDTTARPDVNQVASLLVKNACSADGMLFGTLSLEQYEKQIKQAASAVSLGHLNLCPHMLRHSGASHDAFHQERSLKEIQVRGRWKAVQSVNRYRKPGLMLLRQSSVPRSVWKKADQSRQLVLSHLRKFFG